MVAVVPILSLLLGFALLIAGAEGLVRGASRLALIAGISPLVIGLVVVSLGTSAPEIAISTGSAWQGKADLAVGNVLGSNVFNVLFILGITAMVAPLVVRLRLIRMDIPLMVAAAVVLATLSTDATLDRLDGIVLVALAIAYIVMNVRLARKDTFATRDGIPTPDRVPTGAKGITLAIGLALVGLIGLVVGARLTVEGASAIARSFGASDLVIGLTVVAAGTGLPEAVTSLMAAIRGERDIAIGNIVGSNILNITLVLGLSSLVSPSDLALARGVLTFDLPVMIAVFVAVLPVVFTGQQITRWEGGVFFLYYVAYVTFLVLTATVHPSADEFAFALIWYALPLTLIMLAGAVWQEVQSRKMRRSA